MTNLLPFIPSIVAAIVGLVALISLFWKNPAGGILGSLGRKLGFSKDLTLIVFAVVMLFFAGGLPVVMGWFTSTTGAVASVSQQQQVQLPETVIDQCIYSTGVDAEDTNASLRTDPNSNNRVYIDLDESGWVDSQETNEINVNFSCVRSGQIQEDGVAHIVVKTPTFRSETSTSDSNEYRIVDTTSTPSAVFSGEYKQTLYVDEGSVSTSDTKEEAYLTFSEGDKELTLGVLGELDSSAEGNLNNYTQKDITIYQRMEDGSENPLGYITINKIP